MREELSDFITACEEAGGIAYGARSHDRTAGVPGVLLISHGLSLTGAPIALLSMVRTVREMGYEPIVVSFEDGCLKDEVLTICSVLVVVPHRRLCQLVPTYVQAFSMIVVRTACMAVHDSTHRRCIVPSIGGAA